MTDQETASSLLAGNVRFRRKALRLTQHELAAQTGLSRVLISTIETRYSNPTATTLIAIASALDCSVDWLLGLDR